MRATKSFSSRWGLYLAVVGLAIITTSASAVQYTYTGETGGGLGINIYSSGLGAITLDVGQMNFTTPSVPTWISPLSTYCTDVGVLLADTHSYTAMSFTDWRATGVNPTWISGGIQNAARIWYAISPLATTVDQQAGLQLAIWEALYNNSPYTADSFFSPSNGGFYIKSSDAGDIATAVNDAVGYLNGLSSDPAAPSGEWLGPINSNGSICGSQGLFYPICPVPEATSTLMILGAALTTLGFASRKLRSK